MSLKQTRIDQRPSPAAKRPPTPTVVVQPNGLVVCPGCGKTIPPTLYCIVCGGPILEIPGGKC